MSTSAYRLRGRLGAGLILLLSLAIPRPAQAQADPDSVKLRNDCRFAAQVLSTGQPATHREDALATIGLCGTEAISPLISMWDGDLIDRHELLLLVTATRHLVAAPIADRLFEIMGDPTAPLDTRLATIMVTVTWADPHALPELDDLRDRGPESMRFRHWVIDHAVPMSGRESLGAGFVDRLRSALEGIAASDPIEEMRAAAVTTLRSPPLW